MLVLMHMSRMVHVTASASMTVLCLAVPGCAR